MKQVSSRVEAYSRFFPDELAEATKGFNDKIRRAVIAVLIIRGDLAFMELAGELDISKGLLSHHLDLLLDSAFVRNYSPSELKGRYDSFYGISPFGEAFVNSVMRSFALKPRILPSSNQSSNRSSMTDFNEDGSGSAKLTTAGTLIQEPVSSSSSEP